MTPHRVLLIRPWDLSDSVGGGCCGGGSTTAVCVDPPDHPVRHGAGVGEPHDGDALAAVYLALREDLPGDVDVEIVDPRNHFYLLPAIVRDVRRRGGGWRDALGAAVHGPASAAVIVDGQAVSSGELPPPGDAVRQVRDALGLQGSPRSY